MKEKMTFTRMARGTGEDAPAYSNEPIEVFEPMLRRVLDKPWAPPSGAR